MNIVCARKKRSYCVTHFTSPWSSILIIRQIAATFAAADDFSFSLVANSFQSSARVKLMRRRWQSFAIKPHQLGKIHLAVICKLNMSTLRESMTEQGSAKCGKWRKEVKMMRCSCSLLLSRSRTEELFITIQLATCKKKEERLLDLIENLWNDKFLHTSFSFSEARKKGTEKC